MTAAPAAPAGGWLAALSARERHTLFACFAGWALDGMDFQIFPLVIPALLASWSISKADAGLLGTVTLLMSALGGWLAGQLADRIGRVRTLQLTVLWFSFFTALCGLCQNFDQLMLARGLMGLGFGGEWTAGSVLIAEAVAARYRGRAVGLVQSAWSLGWAAAVLLATLVFDLLPAAWSWRVLFLIGLLPALLLFFIRRHLEEPALHRRAAATHPSSFLAIFAARRWRTTLAAALLLTGMQGGYHAIVTWLPAFLKISRGLSLAGSGASLAVIIAGSFAGYLTGAWLTDALGRRRQILLFAIGGFATVLAYTRLDIPAAALVWLGLPLGFFPSGIFSGVGALLSELFPTAIRASGQGFCYNAGRGLGALVPWLIGLLADRLGLGEAVGLFAAGSYLLVLLSIAFLPETRGIALPD